MQFNQFWSFLKECTPQEKATITAWSVNYIETKRKQEKKNRQIQEHACMSGKIMREAPKGESL